MDAYAVFNLSTDPAYVVVQAVSAEAAQATSPDSTAIRYAGHVRTLEYIAYFCGRAR